MQKVFLKFSNVLFYFETKKMPMSKLTPIFGALEKVKIFSGPQHS